MSFFHGVLRAEGWLELRDVPVYGSHNMHRRRHVLYPIIRGSKIPWHIERSPLHRFLVEILDRPTTFGKRARSI